MNKKSTSDKIREKMVAIRESGVLPRGYAVTIAKELGTTKNAVYQVMHGNSLNEKIIEAVMKLAKMKNKNEKLLDRLNKIAAILFLVSSVAFGLNAQVEYSKLGERDLPNFDDYVEYSDNWQPALSSISVAFPEKVIQHFDLEITDTSDYKIDEFFVADGVLTKWIDPMVVRSGETFSAVVSGMADYYYVLLSLIHI